MDRAPSALQSHLGKSDPDFPFFAPRTPPCVPWEPAGRPLPWSPRQSTALWTAELFMVDGPVTDKFAREVNCVLRLVDAMLPHSREPQGSRCRGRRASQAVCAARRCSARSGSRQLVVGSSLRSEPWASERIRLFPGSDMETREWQGSGSDRGGKAPLTCPSVSLAVSALPTTAWMLSCA